MREERKRGQLGPSEVDTMGRHCARAFHLLSLRMYIRRCFSDPGMQGKAMFLPCSHREQCQADFLQTHFLSFGIYVATVGSDVYVVSVPGSRGQTHVTPEPSVSRLSVALAIIHFPRRLRWRPRGKMTCSRSHKICLS